MNNVIITDASYKHTLGIVRALGKVGINPFVVSHKKYSLSGLSKYAKGEVILKKDYSEFEFIDALKELNIDLVILVGTDSFKKIVPWKKRLLARGINIITVDYEKLNFAFNKMDVYEYAKNIGVPTARTIYPKTIDEVVRLANNIDYPCVIKGLYEVGGNIVDYAYSKNDLVEKYAKLCRKYGIREDSGLPMLQEYITGSGCAFFAVYNNGKCGLTFQHKRIREYPVSGGASVCAESYKNDLVGKYGRALLDALNWHGVAMVEFKLNKENLPILMEINPKFWGSTDLALEAGVNFPKALVDIHNGVSVECSNEYKFPFKYHWPLHGDFLHAIDRVKNLPQVLVDLIDPRVKSNIWLSDFKPTFSMLISFIKNLLLRFIWRRI